MFHSVRSNSWKELWLRLCASKYLRRVPESTWISRLNALSEIPLGSEKSAALQRVTEAVKEMMASHACTITLVDLERRVLVHAAGTGPNEAFERSMEGREIKLNGLREGGALDLSVIQRGELFARYHLAQNGGGVAKPKVARQYGLSAVLCAPLRSDGRVIGYLNHFSAVSRPFTAKEEHLLGICAHQAATTLERFNQYQARDLLATLLHELSQSLLSVSLDTFFKKVSTTASAFLKVSTCIVWTLDETTQKLTIASATDNVDEKYRKFDLPLEDPDIKAHLLRKTVAYVRDVSHSPKEYKYAEAAQERGWVALLSAPMYVGERLVGMLDIYTHAPRVFPKDMVKNNFPDG